MKVLFVCHGNICRSPMAEFIFKKYYPNIACQSRALSNEENGNDIYPAAKRCLDSHGISYQSHHARKISQQDYDDYDLIYIMDKNNDYLIHKMFKDEKHKIKMLDVKDIEDPWYTGDFEGVYQQISKAIVNMRYIEK